MVISNNIRIIISYKYYLGACVQLFVIDTKLHFILYLFNNSILNQYYIFLTRERRNNNSIILVRNS